MHTRSSAQPSLGQPRRPSRIPIAAGWFSLFALLWFSAVTSQADEANDQVLKTTLTQVAETYYRQIYRDAFASQHFRGGNIKELSSHINRLAKAGEHTLAAATLVNHLQLAIEHIDARRSPFLLGVLLEHHLLDSANKLAQAAFDQADSQVSSRVHYRLAVYYFNHAETDLAIKHLTSIEAENALTQKEQDYATLIFGIALQQLKKHREALKIYQKIGPRSWYFSYAQLNSAVAMIRQGWWTDAQIAIEQALEADTPSELKDLNNRLLVVLAYSQLKNEFYRNARQNFRKVSIDSAYVERALLGVGLSALSQKDYAAAVNAFSRLKEIDSNELTALEAHLMVPYTYNQMGDTDQAAVNYAEAVAFFDAKKRFFDVQLLNLQRANNHEVIEEWIDQLPEAQRRIYRHTQNLRKIPAKDKNLEARLISLSQQVNARVSQTIAAALQEKITYVQSYTSQSQYGLAKLYDQQ